MTDDIDLRDVWGRLVHAVISIVAGVAAMVGLLAAFDEVAHRSHTFELRPQGGIMGMNLVVIGAGAVLVAFGMYYVLGVIARRRARALPRMVLLTDQPPVSRVSHASQLQSRDRDRVIDA